jgi:hypothetical protein
VSLPLHNERSKALEVQDMSLVTLTRDEETELEKIKMARQALERSFALPSEKAKAMQFYAELARSEGFSSAEPVQNAALRAIDELTRMFFLLDRLSRRASRVNRWLEERQQVNRTDEDKFADAKKAERVAQKIYVRLGEIFEAVTEIVSVAWNYLPLELQVMTESLTRRFYLEDQKLFQKLGNDYFESIPESYQQALGKLVFFVFSAVEENKEKPKLELLKLTQHYESIGQLEENAESLSTSEIGLVEIKEVVQTLAELPNVKKVRAIANSFNDLYEVTFEVLPCNIDSPENGELVKRAISIVIEAEWKLSDLTNNESWLFGVQMVGGFELNPKDNRVVASSYVQP